VNEIDPELDVDIFDVSKEAQEKQKWLLKGDLDLNANSTTTPPAK